MRRDPNPKQAQLSGAALILLSSFFFGMYGVWIRLMGHSFGSYIQAGIRCSLVALVLLIIGKPKTWQRFYYKRDKKWFGLLLVTSAFNASMLYYATLRIGVGLATLIAYVGILLAMFAFGTVFNKEKLDRIKMITTFLALIGLYLVFAPSIETFSALPLLAALVSGVAAGLNVCVNQKLKYGVAQTAFIAWSAGALINLPIGIILQQDVPHSFDRHWLYLLGFVAISVCASWAFTRGIRKIETGLAGIIGLMEIVFGLLFGILFFHERPAFIAYIGALLILLAAALPSIKDTVEHRKNMLLAENERVT